ncbi:unnamed protein product [Litomosoides sigmodontis]|uniref:LRRNT domain-containing protein n=1 Tax=Litomosoides sigmodontis TaxID=42156 RepID=A0A3P6VGG4_LITSI|nr:unnamed protein product [Litomosoides sigmodontis]
MDATDSHILLILLYYYVQPVVNIRNDHVECPRRCSCIPDLAEPDRFVINCKWSPAAVTSTNKWKQEIFAQFPLNITKTLNIECDNDSSSIIFDANLFNGFQNLQNLRIQKCRTNTLPNSLLHNLSNLRSVHFNQLNEVDQQLTLPDEFFQRSKRLEKLTIVNCNLNTLPHSLICDSPNIQVVNVSHNSLRTIRLTRNTDDVIGDKSTDNYCNDKAEQLIIFDLSNNQIRLIADSDLTQFVAVRQLLLANNQITVINRNALKACTLLQQLQLGNNSIEELPVMPETLIHLDVSFNRLSIIPSTIANLPNLQILNVSGNAIDENTPFPVISATVKSADLSRNRFEFIPQTLLISCAQQLQHLLLSYNRITQLESSFFQNYSNLLVVSSD